MTKIGMGKEYEKKEDLMQKTLGFLKTQDLQSDQDVMSTAKLFLHGQDAEEGDKELVLIALRGIPLFVLKNL